MREVSKGFQSSIAKSVRSMKLFSLMKIANIGLVFKGGTRNSEGLHTMLKS